MKTVKPTRLLPTLFFISMFLFTCNQNGEEIASATVTINGVDLYYEIVGKGEPLVLIHGNGGDRRHWDEQFLPLSKDFQVIRYDVRCYGKSVFTNSDIEFSHHDDLKVLLDHLEIERAHICGLSMGSGIAVDFALAYPKRCRSLIPIGSWANGYGTGDFVTPASDSLFSIMGKVASIASEIGIGSATDYFWTGNDQFKNTIRLPRTIEKMKTIGYDYSFWNFINPTKQMVYQPLAITALDKIKIPTLIVIGEYDLEVCNEIADLMEEKIEDAKKIIIKDSGHIMNMDQPAEFNRLVTALMKEQVILEFN